MFGAGGIYAAFLYYGSLQEDVFRYAAEDGSKFTEVWFLQVLEAAFNVVVGFLGLQIAESWSSNVSGIYTTPCCGVDGGAWRTTVGAGARERDMIDDQDLSATIRARAPRRSRVARRDAAAASPQRISA